MKRRLLATALSLTLILLSFSGAAVFPAEAFDAGSTVFISKPQTQYASTFIAKCDGQQWFLDLVETDLRSRGLSINTLGSKADLNVLQTLTGHKIKNSGTLPTAIGEFGALKYLFFADIGLTGTIPSELYNCTKLENLDLSGNELEGGISANVSNLTQLKVLLLHKNGLTGQIPALPNTITNLDLSSNKLSGGIPSSLPSSALVLNISDNSLGGEIPASVTALSALRILMLWNCGLTGTIPDALGSLTNLEILDLSQNNFIDSVPSTFSGLTNLKRFAAADNELSGTLPATFPTTLEVLDLARNKYSGAIPEALGALNDLKKLDLDGNALSSTIPNIWDEMTDLELVWLRSNKLVSDLPDSLLARYKAGVDVRIDNNYISGENAAKLAHNVANFIKDPTGEYQLRLTMEADTKAIKGTNVNIYNMFKVKRVDNGQEVTNRKLATDQYQLVLTSYLENPDEWFEITSDADGIYVKLLKDVDRSDPLEFELRMLPYIERETYTYTTVKLWNTEQTGATPRPTSTPRPTVTPRPTDSPGNSGGSGGGGGGGSSSGSGGTSGGGATTTTIPDPQTPLADKPSVPHGSYFGGYPDKTFRPSGNFTREEAAIVLWRISGKPSANYDNSYNDVELGRWSETAIAWALGASIMTGDDNRFRPSDAITRAEFAAILVRLEGLPQQRTDKFADALEHWANGYIGTAESRGFMTGYPEDGTFRPSSPITRAEAVSSLNRLLGRTKNSEQHGNLPNPYTDVNSSHWAFWDILEATVEHKV